MLKNTFEIDSDGTITLRGYYHIYKHLYDTRDKADMFIEHLCTKYWFKGRMKQKTIKAMGL